MTQDAVIASIATAARSSFLFCCALVAGVAVEHLIGAPRIFGALVATTVLAMLSRVLSFQLPQFSNQSQPNGLLQLPFDLVAAGIGLGILAHLFPAVEEFVCEPPVPWNIWIAIFGALAVGFLGNATFRPGANANTSLMVLLSVFWIAPFFGYFYGPWFFAQAVALPCASRSQFQAILAAIAMVPASLAGLALAYWLFEKER